MEELHTKTIENNKEFSFFSYLDMKYISINIVRLNTIGMYYNSNSNYIFTNTQFFNHLATESQLLIDSIQLIVYDKI